MTANINSLDHPTISWVADQTNNLDVVSGIRGGARYFQLWENNKCIREAESAIIEIGVCVQRWYRCDKERSAEVRMFTIPKRAATYFVYSNFKGREIRVYVEKLDHSEWESRVYTQQPDVSQGFWNKWFESYQYPGFLGWDPVVGNDADLWTRSNEKSEVGIVRTRVDEFNCVFNETVLYSGKAINELTKSWTIAQVVHVKECGNGGKITYLLGKILSRNECDYLKALLPATITLENYNKLFENDCVGVFKPHNLDEQIHKRSDESPDLTPQIRKVSSAINQAGGHTILLNFCTPKREGRPFEKFMADSELDIVSLDVVKEYVTQNCLEHAQGQDAVSSEFKKNGIVNVRRAFHRFKNFEWFQSIHIHLNLTVPTQIWKSIKAFVPALTVDGRNEEYEIYGSDINTDPISHLLLKRNLKSIIGKERFDKMTEADRKQAETDIALKGIDELNRSYARGARVDAYLSLDRNFGEVFVDQRLHFGYRLREVLSRDTNNLGNRSAAK